MLRLWDISIYVRLGLLVGNKSIWSGYDLEKKITMVRSSYIYIEN